MNNNKMARVAKRLDVFANVVSKLTVAAGIVCVAVAFLTIAFGDKMFAEGAVTLDLDFIKVHISDNTYVNERFLKLYVSVATLGGSVICFVVYYISKLLREILASMKIGRPFEAGISRQLKKVGWSVLFGGFLSEAVGVVARMLLTKVYSIDEIFASAAVSKVEFMFGVNFAFVLIACALFLLSYIFAYGQILQQDVDEIL